MSLTSTGVTSNIVISTPYPSKQHKESRGTWEKSDWTASQILCNLSALAHPPSPSAVISQSFNTVIRLFFFIILFVKRVTICMCLRMDESFQPTSHSFTSHLPFFVFFFFPSLFLCSLYSHSSQHFILSSIKPEENCVILILYSFFLFIFFLVRRMQPLARKSIPVLEMDRLLSLNNYVRSNQ